MADMIAELKGLDDSALAKKLGFSDKVEGFKKDLERADKLDGPARAKVEARLKEMFTPHVYVEGFSYDVDRAEKKASGKTTPSDIVGCCCDLPEDC